MATSGTIGNTVISTAKVIEHAVRRCGLSPTSITGEVVEIATEALYLLLLQLANRGLNLWCLQTSYIGFVRGKSTYDLPVGTIDLLNIVLSRPSALAGTNTQLGSDYTKEFTDTSDVIRIGIKFASIAATEAVTVSVSDDGVTFTPLLIDARDDWAAGGWYWLPLDPVARGRFVRVSTIAAIDVAEFYAVGSLFDIPLTPFNRDTYMALPNKQILSSISTNYYYDRKTQPRVALWPVPDDEHNHITVIAHRQVQDVGSMTQEIELPERWREAIIWQLAQSLCFELPGVEPTRVQLVMQIAAKNLAEVEMEEGDGAPIRFNVGIGGYNK